VNNPIISQEEKKIGSIAGGVVARVAALSVTDLDTVFMKCENLTKSKHTLEPGMYNVEKHSKRILFNPVGNGMCLTECLQKVFEGKCNGQVNDTILKLSKVAWQEINDVLPICHALRLNATVLAPGFSIHLQLGSQFQDVCVAISSKNGVSHAMLLHVDYAAKYSVKVPLITSVELSQVEQRLVSNKLTLHQVETYLVSGTVDSKMLNKDDANYLTARWEGKNLNYVNSRAFGAILRVNAICCAKG